MRFASSDATDGPAGPVGFDGSEGELDEHLTRPSPALLAAIRHWSSPLVLIGAGGKMGPTLAVLAQRAAAAAGHPLEVIAASRFSNPAARDWLEARGVRTMACDLFDPKAAAQLPDTANLVYLVGLKFGTSNNAGATWAANTLVPARVCERFANARIVALSTANVYPATPVDSDGAEESATLEPVGEYGSAAVARERIFEFQSHRHGTPVVQLRLCYAVALRYGILSDIARRVVTGEPVPLANGWFNCIWQGDANEAALRALPLASSPPTALNLSRPERISVRAVANRFGELLGRRPVFSGTESDTALLINSGRLCRELGEPGIRVEQMIEWTAHWIRSDGRDLGRPTHFETRDGRY